MDDLAGAAKPMGAPDAAWLAETSPDGLFALDAELRLVFHNATFARLLGRAGEDLRGSPCSSLFSCRGATDAEGPCAVRCALRTRLEAGAATVLEELPIGPGDPLPRRAEVVLARVADTGRGRAAYAGSLRDPFPREQARRRQADFLDLMGHELRTPLVSIKGYTDLILFERLGPVERRQKKGLAIVMRNVDRLLGLIQNMLSHAKLAAGGLKPRPRAFALQKALQRAGDALVPDFAARGLSFEMRCPEPELAVRGDEDLLVQVLRNLLANAVRASPYGGRIRLDAVPDEPAGQVVVRLEDQGCGLAASAFAALLSPGWGTSTAPPVRGIAGGGGVGLGMGIIHGILALHGTRLTGESLEGEGTRFAFRLPLTEEPVAAPAPAPESRAGFGSAARPASAPRRRVLVVDDDDDVRNTLRDTLETGGYAVLPAETGEQALSVVDHNEVDFVLLDVAMKEMDGIELCRRLKGREGGRHVPVYMMTAATSRELRVRSFQAGADGFLEKPFSGEVLLGVVEKVLHGAVVRAVAPGGADGGPGPVAPGQVPLR
ncbi:MAG: response regulator [Planctomycetes bacterium]|nr:response regulator [Planctomycetota bacterium]